MKSDIRSDITLELLKKYFEAGKLGELSVELLSCGTISADLDQFYRQGLGVKFFEYYRVAPENIESIAVYGSALSKHIPEEKIIKIKKKYKFFGPEFKDEAIEPRKMPNEFDIMVITKEGFTDDKIIIPERPLAERVYLGSMGAEEAILLNAVKTKKRVLMGNEYGDVAGNANLYIAYRSVEQFLAGLGKGDELSASVVEYGVPVIGQKRFKEIVQNVDFPKRKEPLYTVIWTEDLDGKLQGQIS